MALQTQTASEFYHKISDIVEKTNLSYIDSILYYCDEHKMEPEAVAPLINTKMKAQIRDEAEELHFLPKTTKLPL
jgi:hypothetical protein